MNDNTFELLDTGTVASLGVGLAQYVHRETGARHLHLDCADRNNAFMVAFPTLPEDSTGVAHILEHTTLCGSRRYPVRDPFFMMLRRSLNTYMNAFTASDATAYPFATQNRKDFDNLLGVYLDAVFFPQLDPLDFAQEGWRLELAGEAARPRLEYHGVVYNEMKGAMSSPLAQLWQHLHTALFPDTVYRHNSGGAPLDIPALTYDALAAFHARHYHPSNAVFMTYGSFPVADHQARIEELALRDFHDRRAPLLSAAQAPFTAPRETRVEYDAEASEPRHTHAAWAWAWGDSALPEDMIAMHLLETVLLEHSASPLRQFLETTALADAPSELCGIDDSARQLVFVCGVEGTEVEHVAALERGVLGVLERVAEAGLEPAVLEAAIDRLEMAQRDIDGGSFPFGLQLMQRLLPAAMYQRDPLALLDLDGPLRRLRGRLAEPGYLRGLVRRVLLDNPHRVRVVMAPDGTKAARERELETQRLAALCARLDEDERAAIEHASAALADRQAAADDADVLPRVTLADVPPPVPLMCPRPLARAAPPIAAYECAANGVFRARLAYRLPRLDAAELRVLPLWCEYLTELGCGREGYLAVQERRARAGSFSAYAVARPAPRPGAPPLAWLVVTGKGLGRKRDAVLDNVAEMVEGARFDEPERLRELLAQSRAEAEQSITERGHQLAVLAAARTLSPMAALDELWEGPSAIRLLQHYGRGDAGAAVLDELFALFGSIRSKLADAPREVALIGEAGVLEGAEARCGVLGGARGDRAAPFGLDLGEIGAAAGWTISSQVNFCARAYAAAHEAEPAAAALTVLGHYLQDGFLHREIREKGGAYGSGAGYDADSQTFRLFSYRDPRCLETFDDFSRALEWFLDDRDDERLEEAILGTIRALDQPRSPAGEADRAFVHRLCGRDDATRRAFRESVLAVTHDALREACRRYLPADGGARGVLAGGAGTPELEAAGFELERL